MSALKDNAGSATNEKRDWNLGGGSQSVSPRFWKTFLTKMAIAARLLGKEIHRKKLRWFDLSRANYRLGKKVYERQLALPKHSRIIDRLNKFRDRIEELRQPVNSGSSFKERAIAVAKGGARFMKIQMLKFRRANVFRILGRQTREHNPCEASLASEIALAKAVSDRIQKNDADIRELAPRTYLWARRPLATVSIAIAASLLYAGITNQRAVAAPDVSTPKKAVQAFLEALERNDLALSNSLVIGTAEQVSVAKRKHDLDAASTRLEIAKARKFEGDERAKEEADKSRSKWVNANEQIEKDSARVSSGWFGRVFVLLREGPGWKIDLSRSSNGLGVDLVDQPGQSVLTVLNEVTERIEKGYYKNKDEVDHDVRAKFAPLIAATEPKSSPAPRLSATPQPQVADIEALGRTALLYMQALDDEAAAISRGYRAEVVDAKEKSAAMKQEANRALDLLIAATAEGNERAAAILNNVSQRNKARAAKLEAIISSATSDNSNTQSSPPPQEADIEALGRAALQCMQAFDDELAALSRGDSLEVIAAAREKRIALEPESNRAAGLLRAAAAAGNERAAAIVNIVRKRNEERTEKMKALWKESTPLVLSDGRRVRINDDDGEYYATKDPGDHGVKLTGAAKEEAQRLRAEWDLSRKQAPNRR